jgi:DNA ligase-1
MNRFADLIDRLSFEPQRGAKVALVTDYLRLTPDPDRGLGLAALCGALRFKSVKPGTFKQLVETRVDGELFRLSYDFVGDLAETIALIWPAQPGGAAPSPSLATIAISLETAPRADVPRLIETWLNSLDAKGRYALIKSLSGGMRRDWAHARKVRRLRPLDLLCWLTR